MNKTPQTCTKCKLEYMQKASCEREKGKVKMEELKNIKVAVRWAKNGRKYVYENPSQKKIAKLIKKYNIDQICGACLWLCQ